MNKLFLAGTALAALAAFPLSAQPPAGGPAAPQGSVTRAQMQQDTEQRFKERDANHDGVLTADELGPNGARMIERLDADHDGKVTLQEMVAAGLARFDRADTNHDGVLTQEERTAFAEQMRARMQQRQEQAAQPAPQGQ